MPSISLPTAALAAGAIGGAASIASGAMNAGAINGATKAQTAAEQQALALQQNQFNQTQANLSPFLRAGNAALNGQLALLGLPAGGTGSAGPDFAAYVQGNPDLLNDYHAHHAGESISQYGQDHWSQYGQNEGRQVTPFGSSYETSAPAPGVNGTGSPAQMQQSAIDALKLNPLYTSLINQGDQAILANASATGGLRSGNTNYNLANFNANTLAQVYQQMLGNLGSVSGLGANAALGMGQLGQNFANSGSNILGNIGSANAGGILGSSGALAGGINNGLGSMLNGFTLSKLLGQSGGINVNPVGSILSSGYNIPGGSVGPRMTTTDLGGVPF